ncbi:MAG: M28 family metallopeptidase [Clostridiaceae bacterium]
MKRKFYVTILCTLTILLLFLVNLKLRIPKFNSCSFIKVTKDLSSDFYKGRMIGSIENEYAGYYIKDKLSTLGVAAVFEKYSALCPVKGNSIPYIKVYDRNGKLKKEYKYGTDFKEDMGNFKINSLIFSNKDKISKSDYYIQVFKNNDSFLLLSPQDGNISFRSSFIKDSPFDMVFLLKKEALTEINKFIADGCNISLSTPITIENKNLSSVVGIIKGKDSSYPPLILSAHYDHVGTDFSGNIYNGALDNASGVSFVYQMAEYIKDMGQPKGDIYIVLFNGEEGGFLGSYDFCMNHFADIKNGKVLNFDMIGSTSVPLCIMTAEKDSPEEGFAKEMSKICKNYKLNFNYLYQNASDHTPFREAGIDAITFCDDDTSKIHTPADKINIIDKEGGERCFKVVSKEILNYEYNDNIIFYVDYLIIAASALVIIFLALLVRNKRRDFKSKA